MSRLATSEALARSALRSAGPPADRHCRPLGAPEAGEFGSNSGVGTTSTMAARSRSPWNAVPMPAEHELPSRYNDHRRRLPKGEDVDRVQLDRALHSLHIAPTTYSLAAPSHEAYCMSEEPDGWHVFYSERGLRTGDRVFSSEASACDALLEMITSDPLTRSTREPNQ